MIIKMSQSHCRSLLLTIEKLDLTLKKTHITQYFFQFEDVILKVNKCWKVRLAFIVIILETKTVNKMKYN